MAQWYLSSYQKQNMMKLKNVWSEDMYKSTDYGHPDRAFFQKFETFGLGQTNWAEILWGIWGISGQTISTILALWVPCPWESVAGSLSYKKLWFLGLKHTTPKCSQNKIWAVKNLGNSVRTSVFGGMYNITSLTHKFEFLYQKHSMAAPNFGVKI